MMVKRAEDVQQNQGNDGLRHIDHAQSGAKDLKIGALESPNTMAGRSAAAAVTAMRMIAA
jgi:hypothetical protein